MDALHPPFLRALGLERDADERAIRRAYAQRLKKIDQALDVPGFQALREAYEQALRWASVQAQREASPEPDHARAEPGARHEADAHATETPVDASPAAPAIHPAAAPRGDQVFAVFLSRANRVFNDEAEAREALDAALADERLINLEARQLFEWRIACLLFEGWRPGHEFLFGPACACFNWEKERRQLALFGTVGAVLDAAINEKLVFFRQPPTQFEAERSVIRRLRQDDVPAVDALRNLIPTVHRLAQRYPHWLRLVTSQENAARWQETWEALPHSQRAGIKRKAVSAAGIPKVASMKSVPWWSALIVISALTAIGRVGESGSRSSSAIEHTYSHAVPTALPVPKLTPPAAAQTTSTTGKPASLFDMPAPPRTPVAAAAAAPASQQAPRAKQKEKVVQGAPAERGIETKNTVAEPERKAVSTEPRVATDGVTKMTPLWQIDEKAGSSSPPSNEPSKYELLEPQAPYLQRPPLLGR